MVSDTEIAKASRTRTPAMASHSYIYCTFRGKWPIEGTMEPLQHSPLLVQKGTAGLNTAICGQF